jgi:hypothetical protein
MRIKLRRVDGFRRKQIEALARRNFDPASTVFTDGLGCFIGVRDAGCAHHPIVTGSGRKAALTPAFKWVNTALANIKYAMTGPYRAVRKGVPQGLLHGRRYAGQTMNRPNVGLLAPGPRGAWTEATV